MKESQHILPKISPTNPTKRNLSPTCLCNSFFLKIGGKRRKIISWSYELDETQYSQNFQYKKCMIIGKEKFSLSLTLEGKKTEFESRDARSYNARDQ